MLKGQTIMASITLLSLNNGWMAKNCALLPNRAHFPSLPLIAGTAKITEPKLINRPLNMQKKDLLKHCWIN